MIPESKILITKFPHHSRLGGVEKHTFQIVENLQDQGCKFFLLSSCGVMLSEFRKRGWGTQRWWLGIAPVTRLTKWLFLFSAPFLVVSAIIGLIYARVKFGTTKLYCLTITEKLVMTPFARLFGYKVFWLEHLSISPAISNNIYKFLYQWWSGMVEIIAVSKFVKDELAKINVRNVQVIYHGIEIEKYKKQESIFEAMAERKSDKTKKVFRVGAVSQLEPIKGLGYLVLAIGQLKTEIPEIDLVIVGEGSQRSTLQWFSEEMKIKDKVKLVGYKDNFLDCSPKDEPVLWRGIYDFDLFVLPSLKESLGIVAIEALACEKPVIATDVGGLPEVIENEKQGLLVPPQNSMALAEAILRIYKDKNFADELARAGREKVSQQFRLDEMLEKYKRELIS